VKDVDYIKQCELTIADLRRRNGELVGLVENWLDEADNAPDWLIIDSQRALEAPHRYPRMKYLGGTLDAAFAYAANPCKETGKELVYAAREHDCYFTAWVAEQKERDKRSKKAAGERWAS
jgi:hypothetical protein